MEAALKPRRSVVKRQKKDAAKQARKQGAAEAVLNNVPTSPRKMRLIADLIRGEKVNTALSILKFQPLSRAKRLEKLLLSALANWQAKNEDLRIDDADLYIKEIFVDAGRMLKRLRPAPQGRAYRVRKRSNHITLVIDSTVSPSPVKVEETAAKETKPEAKAKSTEKKAAAGKTKKTESKAKSETSTKKTTKK